MPISAAAYERWLACDRKTCCSYDFVFPTGEEIVTIAATLGMPVGEVVMAIPSEFSPTAYRLAPTGQAYRLALVRTRNSAQSDPACGFLAQLPDEKVRCGLGALRPARCQTYPAVVRGGRIDVDASGCTCGEWSLDDIDASVEFPAVAAANDASSRYAATVAAWNARVQPPVIHADYFAYLQATYRA